MPINCSIEFERKNYSVSMLNVATDNDAGSWWWWINIIGSLFFGTIGLIGNFICFFVLHRFALGQYSFVEYLRALSIFDLIALFFECFQSLNELFVYLNPRKSLRIGSSLFCQLSEYLSHTMILLACWTIVGLTFDRLILVCDPFARRWPNLSRRICNCQSARKILFIFICLSLLINFPHSISQQWICRMSGHQNSAAFSRQIHFNSHHLLNSSNFLQCKCRISPNIHRRIFYWIIKWKIYVFHLCSYTLIPAMILIASNAAILRRLHAPRQIVGQQNENLRSKLTVTLTLVSLMFLILYFPHSIIQTLTLILLPHYQLQCDVQSLIRIRILSRLCELLNQIGLGMNFFIYILGVPHYRSATIQILGLHHFQCCRRYLTIEHRSSLGSIHFQSNSRHSQSQQRRNTQSDFLQLKLFKNLNQNSPSRNSQSET